MNTQKDKQTIDAQSSQRFTILDPVAGYPQRQVDCSLTAAQLQRLDQDGYIVLDAGLSAAYNADLQAAVDRLRDRVDAGVIPSLPAGAEFYRDIMLHESGFNQLVDDPVLVGVARMMLGPAVRLRSMTCRDNRAQNGGNQGFGWHIHQRGNTQPAAAWASLLQGLDCLLYLDDVDAASGGVALIPGSHRSPPSTITCDQEAQANEVVLHLQAGSILCMHPNCVHRSLPAQASSARRRLVIVSWVPSWYRSSPLDHCDRSEWIAGLSQQWRAQGLDDPARLELLGIGGFT